MIAAGLKRLAIAAWRLLPGRARSDLRWWERRAERSGARAVLNRGHPDAERSRVDEWQKGILLPTLQRQLRGDERTVLDFGCGPGRFTPDLAEVIGGRAIGVDPIQSLLDLAPRRGDVEYRLLENQRIPLEDGSVDVVWICLVLMCITDRGTLDRTVAEIRRVLRPDGLLFLVENTEEKPDTRHIAYRAIDDYRAIFPFAPLRDVGEYRDLGERISILAGRKREPAGGA